MPHIIIEHSTTSIEPCNYKALLNSVFSMQEAIQVFNNDNIKARLQSVKHFKLASNYKGFVHIQCRIHKGRDIEQKEQLSNAVLQAVKPFVNPQTVTTVELIDMESESYAKHINS